MKIENRQQFLIVLTVAAFALLIGDRVIFEPLVHFWSTRSADIRVLRDEVREGNVLKNRESALRQRWNDMQSNALPPKTSQAEQQLFTALDNWSRVSGAEIASIMPQWKYDSTNYMTLNCRVEATGALGALSQFIYDIKRGPMALKLDSVELSAHDATGQQLTLDLQISGLALLNQSQSKK
jgi:Tfp pilus assembly protein PilO